MSNTDGKMCPKCHTYKPLSKFGTRMSNGKNIGQGYCKSCKSALDRVYQQARRDKLK